MRATGWVFVAAIIGLTSSAAGHESGCAQCNGGAGAAQAALAAEACAGPGGYTLVPGCCELSRHCCDNAWAGYCQHRAKVDAFWSRVGGPKLHCRQAAGEPSPTAPCEEISPKAMQPTPAVPPSPVAPALAPADGQKATQKSSSSALR